MSALGNIILKIGSRIGGNPEILLPGESPKGTTERGYTPTPEDRMKYLTRLMWVDSEIRQTILDIREMDLLDPRVKKIHRRTASAAVKGGLRLILQKENKRIRKHWDEFVKRLSLSRREKLTSDARGFVMEGNLAIQWVLAPERKKIVKCVRMPSETILPLVNENGVFKDVRQAYAQIDISTGMQNTVFALWQLTLVRLMPANFDDAGAMGRPYLDAGRPIWRKLRMTEEDLVIRRHERAPLQRAHALDGATPDELDAYKEEDEQNRREGKILDYYSNKKLSVTSLQGDENLDHIKDIGLLLDAFFAGAPAPKGLFGYTDGLSRDILEDIKRDFYDEVDALQDELSQAYQSGFEMELLLNGINPQDHEVKIEFAERRTETPSQATDRALKVQALGGSQTTVWEIAGLEPKKELSRRDDEALSNDPYPDPENIRGGNVSITPGNARKKESATTISTRG